MKNVDKNRLFFCVHPWLYRETCWTIYRKERDHETMDQTNDIGDHCMRFLRDEFFRRSICRSKGTGAVSDGSRRDSGDTGQSEQTGKDIQAGPCRDRAQPEDIGGGDAAACDDIKKQLEEPVAGQASLCGHGEAGQRRAAKEGGQLVPPAGR